MSEAELSANLFSIMIEEGHHGLSRLNMYDTEMILGHIGFGDNSIYPTYFNGPGGNKGLCPAVPLMGSRERLLKKGDLIFIDIGCGYEGYHTDKTMTYVFEGNLPDQAIKAHEECLQVQKLISSMLKPGITPAQIYKDVMNDLRPDFLDNFMGFGARRVKFLGHSLGLAIDESPVIADGFSEPIEEGMFFALEPKKGIIDIGMVGVENTFRVSQGGGILITGDNPGLIHIN
jgi:Xaa-Pro aminopeptidase